MKNKRADIPITILVIGVIVLCTIALFSFYLVGDKKGINGKVNSVSYLQELYNLAESARYSGKDLYDSYEGIEGNIIEKEFFDRDLKITYDLAP